VDSTEVVKQNDIGQYGLVSVTDTHASERREIDSFRRRLRVSTAPTSQSDLSFVGRRPVSSSRHVARRVVSDLTTALRVGRVTAIRHPRPVQSTRRRGPGQSGPTDRRIGDGLEQ